LHGRAFHPARLLALAIPGIIGDAGDPTTDATRLITTILVAQRDDLLFVASRLYLSFRLSFRTRGFRFRRPAGPLGCRALCRGHRSALAVAVFVGQSFGHARQRDAPLRLELPELQECRGCASIALGLSSGHDVLNAPAPIFLDMVLIWFFGPFSPRARRRRALAPASTTAWPPSTANAGTGAGAGMLQLRSPFVAHSRHGRAGILRCFFSRHGYAIRMRQGAAEQIAALGAIGVLPTSLRCSLVTCSRRNARRRSPCRRRNGVAGASCSSPFATLWALA